MGTKRFDYLCRPGKIGPVDLRNRMVMAPHSPNCAGTQGEVNDLLIDYLEARARGGVGLLIVEDTLVVPASKWGEAIAHQPEIWDRRLIDGWRRLADAIHFWGAKAAVQLNWAGTRIVNKLWPGVQPTAPSVFDVPGWASVQRKSSSAIETPAFSSSRAVSLEEIVWLENQFARSAACARDAGFDIIMLHCAQGYGIASFTSPYCNKRNDLYGGSFENRMRFSQNIIRKVREEMTSDMALIVRVSVDEFLPGSADKEESIRIAQAYEAAGVDAIHLSCGLFTTENTIQPIYQPRAYLEPYLPDMRRAISIPLSVAGSFNNPDDAERMLKKHKMDFVDFARALIADPEYPNKVMAGRPEDIRPCTRCCECIHSIIVKDTATDCSVNVEIAKESRLKITPAEKPKSVLIIGGGVAGMEAARVAALRGHHVTLCERSDKLGGNLIPASVPDFKVEYRWLIDWFSGQLDKLGVKVKKNKSVGPNDVTTLKPEVVIVATGSQPIIPDFVIKSRKVVTAIDVLLGKVKVGKHVIVAGGGLIGADTALYLAEKGNNVMIVEMLDSIAADTLVIHRKVVMPRLTKNKVTWATNNIITSIGDEGIKAVDKLSGNAVSYQADTIVLALGLAPVKGLAESLGDSVSEVYEVGDCVKPRRVKEAIWEGSMIARRI